MIRICNFTYYSIKCIRRKVVTKVINDFFLSMGIYPSPPPPNPHIKRIWLNFAISLGRFSMVMKLGVLHNSGLLGRLVFFFEIVAIYMVAACFSKFLLTKWTLVKDNLMYLSISFGSSPSGPINRDTTVMNIPKISFTSSPCVGMVVLMTE